MDQKIDYLKINTIRIAKIQSTSAVKNVLELSGFIDFFYTIFYHKFLLFLQKAALLEILSIVRHVLFCYGSISNSTMASWRCL